MILLAYLLVKGTMLIKEELQPWQIRVLDEKRELVRKIASLEQFLDDKPTNISVIEKALLREQLSVMKEYNEILRRRINCWNI